ncbi:4'-phosphopantetheinyl transferase family protein [candidate division CSSED10-310 bacterium]|uniref:4'-phosphopantetheinyl transferase family protein n=1 Tax=candidate division CSSED10-310 bacterium TaxID=2855610 RepID=A0ABV6Z1R8_UNCC1
MNTVYAFQLPQTIPQHHFERLLLLVSCEKATRIRRFVNMKDRLRCLFADLLIRHVIINNLGLYNDQLIFSTNSYGKPFLKDNEGFFFNLSHSGDWVVGVTDTTPVGIDLERIKPIDLAIAERFFSPEETADLMSKPEHDLFSYFFTLWTLKESYIKKLGTGLSLPLNAFSISFRGPHIHIKEHHNHVPQTFFIQYNLAPDYKMAVCGSVERFPAEVFLLTEKALYSTFKVDFQSSQG